MGYLAPTAYGVYRYALRLDGAERSLTDRFGLSIVLINDDSSACREFVSSYFVKLCHLTADRIRFICFADVSREERAELAHYV